MPARRLALAALVLLFACDAKESPPADAKADDAEAKEDEALKKRAAERKAAEDEKAKEEAELQATIDGLAVVPEALPKNLDAACAAMTKAYDAYMRTVLEGDMKTKWETGGNEMQVKVFDKACHDKGSVAAAACQAAAFGSMKPEHEPHLSRVMTRCAEKAASDAEADAKAP